MHFLLKHANKIIFFLGVCVIIVHGLSYLYGFHSFFIWTWLVVVLSTLISYVFSVLSLILIIFLILKKERFLRFSIIWLVLTSVLIFVPGYYSEIAGALSAFHLAGAKQVKTEARLLIQSCEQFSEKQQNCGYISEYPSAIKRVHPEMVYVSDSFVVIGKLGFIHPDGFMIFSEGVQPIEGMRVKKLGEDLYWTYGN